MFRAGDEGCSELERRMFRAGDEGTIAGFAPFDMVLRSLRSFSANRRERTYGTEREEGGRRHREKTYSTFGDSKGGRRTKILSHCLYCAVLCCVHKVALYGHPKESLEWIFKRRE